MDFCIASPHTSRHWYEYRIYINLKKELEKLGLKYKKNSINRIYFLGRYEDFYKDIDSFESDANNIALMFSRPSFNLKIINKFNHVFTSSHTYFLAANSLKKNNVYMLKPFSSLSPVSETRDEYKCDISFIGQPRLRPIVENITPIAKRNNLNFKIFGTDWSSYSGNKDAINYYSGKIIDYFDIPILANSAKIIIIDHMKDMRNFGVVSHKYIDLLMAKAFVVSDNNKDISNYNGVVFRDEQQILEILHNNDYRYRKSQEQFDLVKNQSTENAAKTIVETLK